MKEKIAVLGSGSWATALMKILIQNGHDVRWWVHRQETVEFIQQFHHNPKYLSSVEIIIKPEKISSDIKKVLNGVDWVVLATPSSYFKASLEGLTKEDFQGKHVISAIKGLIQPDNLTISRFMEREFEIPYNSLSSVTGPCHAEEVAAEKLSYLTLASPDKETASQVAALFKCRFLYTSTSTDLEGTEYASVLKNVYALATGMSIGLDYGDNFRAVLVPRAMLEMEYFINAVCPGKRNLMEPSYLGDTLVTSYSQHSRNRTFGLMIGKGYSINSAILELNMVAEGYYATKSLKAIADANNLRCPILNSVYHILYEKISPTIEFTVLAGELE